MKWGSFKFMENYYVDSIPSSNMNARKTNDNYSTTNFTRNSTLSHKILVLCSLFLKRTLLLFHLKIEKNVENVQEKCPQTHFCVYIILESMLRWSKKKILKLQKINKQTTHPSS